MTGRGSPAPPSSIRISAREKTLYPCSDANARHGSVDAISSSRSISVLGSPGDDIVAVASSSSSSGVDDDLRGCLSGDGGSKRRERSPALNLSWSAVAGGEIPQTYLPSLSDSFANMAAAAMESVITGQAKQDRNLAE